MLFNQEDISNVIVYISNNSATKYVNQKLNEQGK